MFSFSDDVLGLGGVFDNVVTTEDEKQQNQNALLLGQYGIDAQLAASKERNRVIMSVATILIIAFVLYLLFR